MRQRKGAKPEVARQHLHCAIYTRKSTEEGLDQQFNSLDAQREACAAYVLSQRHEGWTLLPALYDDGGFSGGNMERPGIKRLLADVQAGRVDVIVVYKVDRLTRSLADFAKIVETLDAAGTSFVSVTQAFNTTNSMGRLTLNVLLSFAQFEREVTGERIRDKVAASRKKGMWMGGTVPLGYDVQDRKLIINEAEAETVRHLMRRYVELGTVRALLEDLRQSGVRTKEQRLKGGRIRGGVPFRRGSLYHLLKNRLYVGEVPHHDQWYQGEHDGIIGPLLFEQVQELLARNSAEPKRGGCAHPSLLAGLIRDGQGRPMSPSHASKRLNTPGAEAKQRYRYYVSNEAAQLAGAARPMRLPAGDTERAVIDAVSRLLEEAQPIHERIGFLDARAGEHAKRNSRAFGAQLRTMKVDGARKLLQQLDLTVVVEEASIVGSCSLQRLFALVDVQSDVAEATRVAIVIPTRISRRGQELRLRFDWPGSTSAKRDPALIELIVRALNARRQLSELEPASTRDDRRELGRLARLSYLAPDIVQAILEGRQPVELTPRKLIRSFGMPLAWNEQRQMLGFSPAH